MPPTSPRSSSRGPEHPGSPAVEARPDKHRGSGNVRQGGLTAAHHAHQDAGAIAHHHAAAVRLSAVRQLIVDHPAMVRLRPTRPKRFSTDGLLHEPVLWHNTCMGIEWAESADKHDITHADALYAMQNSIYTSTKVKINDRDGRNQRRLFVGPQHAQTDRLIEVLIELKPGGTFVVYHVMPLGSYYRQQMEEETG